MRLGDEILKIFNQTYAADSMVERHVGQPAHNHFLYVTAVAPSCLACLLPHY